MEQAQIDRRLESARVKAAADALSAALKADVVFLNGDMRYVAGYDLVVAGRKLKTKRPNVVIIPVTDGGNADVAYRIGRYLQREYKEVYAFVPSRCKSAGTLLAAAAHKLYMGDLGELGPLDIQISIKDEIGENSSGLN